MRQWRYFCFSQQKIQMNRDEVEEKEIEEIEGNKETRTMGNKKKRNEKSLELNIPHSNIQSFYKS